MPTGNVRVAAMPGATFFNGSALHPHGRTLYVADSVAGVIWAVELRESTLHVTRAGLREPHDARIQRIPVQKL
jgi:sugar lactone lactonase YvrE